MDLQLAGKRALVTGSTSGIGFATARSLAAEGAEVILNGRSRASVVMSGVRLTRHYLPAMKARNWGRVVFISSESAVCPPAEMVHYGMTKSAQLSVARGIAETCVSSGVTVNSILPGPTRTEGVATFFGQLAEEQGVSVEEAERAFFANARPTSIIKRLIDPAEVAAMVTYVCSPLSSATHGAALRVEGGVVRSMV